MLYTAAWFIAVIYSTIPGYWLIIHPRAGHWAGQGGRRLIEIGPVWPLLWMLAAGLTWHWRRIVLYCLRWTWLPAGMLILSGMVIYGFAKQRFSIAELLGYPELEPHQHKQTLRTSGIRRHIRHPYYLGHLCELLGWAIGSGLLVVYGLTLVAMVSGYFMVVAEERELEARFGDEYRHYRRHTATMLPGIW